MEKKPIKVKAKFKNDVVTVKALMGHPMETGNRKDKKTGKKIPARFIQEVVCKSGGKTLMTANWSGGVSKDPYLMFKYKGGKKGDMLELSWVDNTGKSAKTEVKVA
ncbi:MAG: thiosulfate oxidation carrier complex protein SoxZ [Gammaproteobacteria bacterium]|nr:thiosulfate oxidation carrier complex protein SoxZ [Gammaproteobacteria bacterium]